MSPKTPLLLLIIYSLQCSGVWQGKKHSVSPSEQCKQLMQNDLFTKACICTPLTQIVEVNCTNSQQHLHLFIDTTIVIIACKVGDGNSSESLYQLVPSFNIGKHIKDILVDKCPLLEGVPITALLKQLGLRKAVSLEINMCNTGANINRKHMRGLQHLQSLQLKSNAQMRQLPEDLFVDLWQLKSLELTLPNVTALPLNIFAALQQLESLELCDTQLQHLSAELLNKLRFLKRLVLRDNQQLLQLNAQLFHGMSNAFSELVLINNGIDTLPADIFRPVTANLSYVLLMGENSMLALSAALFASKTQLLKIEFDLSSTDNELLPAKFAANLERLQSLQLSMQLTRLPTDLCVNSSALQFLNLTRNRLTQLPPMLLQTQQNLLTLDLSSNRLTTLPAQLFLETPLLRQLMLSHNRLTIIDAVLLRPLTQLHLLHMDNNELQVFDPTLLRHNLQLTRIHLDNNQIRSEYRSALTMTTLPQLRNMSALYLRNNSIRHIQKEWKFVNLKLLDLSHNQINELQLEDLQYPSNSILVNVQHNRVRHINLTEYAKLVMLHSWRNKHTVRLQLQQNPLHCDCALWLFKQLLREALPLKFFTVKLLTAEQLLCATPPALRDTPLQNVKPAALVCPVTQDCPAACNCWQRPHDDTLLVNCTSVKLKQLPSKLPLLSPLKLSAIELDVTNNQLLTLADANDNVHYANVTRLLASHNHLTQLEMSQLPPRLVQLDVRDNRLREFTTHDLQQLNQSRTLQTIALTSNPWLCSCPLLFALSNLKNNSDVQQLQCQLSVGAAHVQLTQLSVSDVCDDATLLTIIVISTLIFLLASAIGVAFYLRYTHELHVWMYAHNIRFSCCACWLVDEELVDRHKRYDAFISYSHKDEEFVLRQLIDGLEHGRRKYKLCVHGRDWLIGEYIADQIVRSIENSRRTIVVLTSNFVESVWGRMEFRLAHQAALDERRMRVIVVIHGEIGEIDELDPDLKAYLKTNTYLQWGDPKFWDKLQYAMPHMLYVPSDDIPMI